MPTTKNVHRREDLDTRGVPVSKIPGLVVCEMPSFDQEVRKLQTMMKPSYTSEEMFGQWVNYVEHIDAPVDRVFEYAANPYSLEEFTATVREIEHVGDGLYKGVDMSGRPKRSAGPLAPNTFIYLKMAVYPDSRVIDCLCAWDQPKELWMRYHFRLFDAQEVVGKPGTMLLWNNFRHPYYDISSSAPPHVADPRARTDRMWVGNFFPLFYAAHAVEARNLKLIVEHRVRAREGGPAST